MTRRILIATLLCAVSSAVLAQSYPSRTARIVVPWTPGGTADLLARLTSQYQSARIKALAVTSAQRAHALPTVPTVADSGVPGFQAIGWFGMAAHAATPKDIIAKLNGELVRVLGLPDVKERITSLGAEVVATTPEGMDKFNLAQIALWAKVVKASGARVD